MAIQWKLKNDKETKNWLSIRSRTNLSAQFGDITSSFTNDGTSNLLRDQ